MFEVCMRKLREGRIKRMVKQSGEGLQVFGTHTLIEYPERFIFGNYLKINQGVVINARGGIRIGNEVTLSSGCKLMSSGYNLEEWKNNNLRIHKNEEIIIGDYVWICANAIICPGVIISGHHVVIAAGAVVTKNVKESNCIVAGVPAQVKCYI